MADALAATQESSSIRKWHSDYQGRELDFIGDVLGKKHGRTGKTKLWAFQRYVIESLLEYRRVAISSSRGSGKTHVLGLLIDAFLLTEPSRVIAIGPTMRQIRLGVLSEARKGLTDATRDLNLARNNATEIQVDERHWVVALPARDPDNMRGFHASPAVPGDPDDDHLSEEDLAWLEEQGEDESTRILIVIDEAAGVSADAFRVLRGMMNKPNVYVVMSANPTLGADDDHDYVRAFREGSQYHRIRVSSVPVEDFPAPSGIEYDRTFDRIPEYLVQRSEVEAALREYHASDPILIADWAGTFASGNADFRVVPRRVLEAAVATNGAKLRPLGPRIGVDIGTGHPDFCVASLFVDGEKRVDHKWAPHADDQEAQVSIANTIAALATQWGADVAGRGPGGSEWTGQPIPGERISIDDSGLVGVCDILASRGILVDRVNFARKMAGQWRDVVGTQRFANIRTELHWVARRLLQEGIAIIGRQFADSWNEATWTRFLRDFDSRGPIIKLEKKEDVIKRHGHSPDTFDADLLALRDTTAGYSVIQGGPRVQSAVQDAQNNGSQPIRAGRLRPTKLKGARKIR